MKHPLPSTFDNTTKFATLRSFTINASSAVVDYDSALKTFCLDPATAVGGVVWPQYPLLFTTNFEAVVDAIADNELFLTDIWAFVPGSGPGDGSRWRENVWQQFYPPPSALAYLQEKLGERWLGMDIGEQDGRYIGSYAYEQLPMNVDRKHQFFNFRDHFKEMEDILGPRLVALVSLTFPHYMAKTGLYTVIGAEAAQALPNSQLFYAFLRGAGKQYGVLWFGNVSVYNRFGYKSYPGTSSDVGKGGSNGGKGDSDRGKGGSDGGRGGSRGESLLGKASGGHVSINYTCHNQGQGGPTCGTSLNLMKRLLYSHMMYGSCYVSFENQWYVGSSQQLSPIGLIQHAARAFMEQQRSLGTHVATIALYLDFFTGFTPPRHLYTGNLYRCWSNLPYSEGDYLADGVLRLVYPQYQDSSYFHNETGFSSPTPFGDTMDALLTDSPIWVLAQYDTIVVASNLSGEREVKDNLEQFVLGGGNLVMTSGNLASFSGGLLGVNTSLKCECVGAGAKVTLSGGQTLTEPYNMTVCGLAFPGNASVLASLADSTPLAVQLTLTSGGSLTVFASPYAISATAQGRPSSQVDQSLASPFPLLEHARDLLEALLSRATLFTSTANLTVTSSHAGGLDFHVLVSNPELQQQPLKLLSPQSSISRLQEVALDQSEKGQEGYLPDGYQGTNLGNSTNSTIAGGDTRLFTVTLAASSSLHFLPQVKPKPPPTGVGLFLRHIHNSIRYKILQYPTFFQHFSSIVISSSYLSHRDKGFLEEEGQWLQQQGVEVFVDASPSIDLFPKLRLINNSAIPYLSSLSSLEHLMQKMAVMGLKHLILSLHRVPENDFTPVQTFASFNTTLHLLSSQATEYGIQLHIRDAIKNPLPTVLDLAVWLNGSGLSSLRIVLNTAILLTQELTPDLQYLIAHQSSLLLLNAPSVDMFGARYSFNTPVSQADSATQSSLRELLLKLCVFRGCPYRSSSPAYPLVLDGYFNHPDEQYLDVRFLEETLYG